MYNVLQIDNVQRTANLLNIYYRLAHKALDIKDDWLNFFSFYLDNFCAMTLYATHITT